MNTNTNTSRLLKTALFAVASLTAFTMSAQNLGDRYVAVDASIIDLDIPATNLGFGTSATFNTPIMESLDFRASYGVANIDDRKFDLLTHSVEAGPVIHLGNETVKGFIYGTFGWSWMRVTTTTFKERDDSMIYGGGAGVQYYITPRVTATALADYTHVKQLHDGEWTYTAALQFALTERVTLRSSVQFSETSDEIYSIGVGYKF